MKLGNLIRQSIKKVDFFQTNQLLRYKAESDYRTVFGGLVSLMLIIILITMFYYRLLSCIQKDDVNATEQKIINEIPSPYTIDTYPTGSFMMAISLTLFDLNAQQKYFSVQMNQIESVWDYDNSQWKTTVKNITLDKCTRDHWKLVPRIEKEYDSWAFDNMLCLSMNSSYDLQGDQFSDTSKKLTIKVMPCKNGSSNANVCAQQTQIDEIFNSSQNIQTRFFMINPNVNPSTKDYIQYTFNYANLLTFSRQQKSYGSIYVEDYEIQTDDSIFPLPMKKIDTGATFSTTIIPKTQRRVDDNEVYCQLDIFKSQISRKYERNFEKFDELLAFIGGLFGTLSMFLLIVNSYNNFAYEISLGSSLFKPQNEKEMSTFRKYNFLSYLLQIFYSLLNFFGFSPNWKSTIEYNKCQNEMEKQLDIQYILDRLTYLETATSTLLEDYQMKGLHLKGKLTLKQAKSRRRAFKLKKGIRQMQKSMKRYNVEENSSNFALPIKFPTTIEQNSFSATPLSGNSFFLSNKVGPMTDQVKLQKSDVFPSAQDDIAQSDSSTDGEQYSNNSDGDGQVLGILNRLRQDSESGDKLSKKIWQITNTAIVNILPELLTKGNGVFFNLNLDSGNDNSNNLQSPKFSEIMPQMESVGEEYVDSVVNMNKLQKPRTNRIRPSRFSKNNE